MISDPILNAKINSYNREFQLHYFTGQMVTNQRMKEQDQGLPAYLSFLNEKEQAYYSGYIADGRQVEGLSTIVLEYFKKFPENLHDSIFGEISAQIEEGYSAKIDGAKLRFNHLMSDESQGNKNRAEELVKSNISHITSKELGHLFHQLREIRQRKLIEEAKRQIPTSYEQIVSWGKNNKIIAGLLIAAATVILVSQVCDSIKNIRCSIFHSKCEEKKDKN